MTVTEIWIGVPATEKAQQEKLDQGYRIQPHAHGAHRGRYVMAHRPGRSRITVWHCVSAAMKVFGFEEDTLKGDRSDWRVFRARAAAMWAARQLGYSSPLIGREFKRDHATVLNAAKRCEAIQAEDDRYRTDCERMMGMVRSA